MAADLDTRHPVRALVADIREAVPRGEQKFEPHESTSGGCVTNFKSGDQDLTIWRSGDARHGWRYALEEFGMGGARLPLSDDPQFQAIAAELHHMAWWVGCLRRRLIDVDRAVARFERVVEEERDA